MFLLRVVTRSPEKARIRYFSTQLYPGDDRMALEEASRALLCADAMVDGLPLTKKEQDRTRPNPILQNVRALTYLLKSDPRSHTEANVMLQDLVELMRGPMMGMTSDSYIDIGGILCDLGLTYMSQGKIKDAEQAMKRSLMMATKAYRVNVHLHTGVLANLTELYRRNLDIDKATSYADKLLVELNNSKGGGGHEMSTKSRWGGDGEFGENYSWLWSDLCFSDIRSIQFYFSVARANANFRSAAEAYIHFNSGFRAMNTHLESFTTVRVHGVKEIEAVGGSIAHVYPSFVQGCIDLAAVKATSTSGSSSSPKPDYLAKVCQQVAPKSGKDVDISSDWQSIMNMAREVIDGNEGGISDGAAAYLKQSYTVAEEYIQLHTGTAPSTKDKGVIETGQRHIMGLALLDARFHME